MLEFTIMKQIEFVSLNSNCTDVNYTTIYSWSEILESIGQNLQCWFDMWIGLCQLYFYYLLFIIYLFLCVMLTWAKENISHAKILAIIYYVVVKWVPPNVLLGLLLCN